MALFDNELRTSAQWATYLRALLHHGLFPEQAGSTGAFASLLDDEQRMGRVFERFVRNFFRQGGAPREVHARALAVWHLSGGVWRVVSIFSVQRGADGKRAARWCMDDAYRLFPRLEERAKTPAGALSGGEQQMLTVCRTLMGNPDLIMVDEPTEGLAPQMVERIADLLQTIAQRNISILLVEQKLTIALRISHRVYVMGHGRMVFEGTPSGFSTHPSVRQTRLEV